MSLSLETKNEHADRVYLLVGPPRFFPMSYDGCKIIVVRLSVGVACRSEFIASISTTRVSRSKALGTSMVSDSVSRSEGSVRWPRVNASAGVLKTEFVLCCSPLYIISLVRIGGKAQHGLCLTVV